jgi:RNA polymerase sigma factor (sigma-70 family)
MKERRPKFTRCMRKAARRRDMAPTPEHLTAIRRSITTTAARFGWRLLPECIEDLVQEVFLGLWKSRAEDKLNCLSYVRRVAANVTIDLLRRQSAQKRRWSRHMSPDLEKTVWRPSRTPEEVLIEREEAQELLATDRALKKRVKWAMKQCAAAQSATGGSIGVCLGTPHLGIVGEGVCPGSGRD